MGNRVLVSVLLIAISHALSNLEHDNIDNRRVYRSENALLTRRHLAARRYESEEMDEWLESLNDDQIDYYYQLLMNENIENDYHSSRLSSTSLNRELNLGGYYDYSVQESRLLQYGGTEGEHDMMDYYIYNAADEEPWSAVHLKYQKKDTSDYTYLHSIAKIRYLNPGYKQNSICSGILVKATTQSARPKVLTNSKCFKPKTKTPTDVNKKWNPFLRVSFGEPVTGKLCKIQSVVIGDGAQTGFALLTLGTQCDLTRLKPWSLAAPNAYKSKKQKLLYSGWDGGGLKIKNVDLVNKIGSGKWKCQIYAFDSPQNGGPIYFLKDNKPQIVAVLNRPYEIRLVTQAIVNKLDRQIKSTPSATEDWNKCVAKLDTIPNEYTPATRFGHFTYKTFPNVITHPITRQINAKVLSASACIINAQSHIAVGSGALVKLKKKDSNNKIQYFILTAAHVVSSRVKETDNICTEQRDRMDLTKFAVQLHQFDGTKIICEIKEALFPLEWEKHVKTNDANIRYDFALMKLKRTTSCNLRKVKAWKLMSLPTNANPTTYGYKLAGFTNKKIYYAGYTANDVAQIYPIEETPKKSEKQSNTRIAPGFSRGGHSGGVFFYVDNKGVGRAVGVLNGGVPNKDTNMVEIHERQLQKLFDVKKQRTKCKSLCTIKLTRIKNSFRTDMRLLGANGYYKKKCPGKKVHKRKKRSQSDAQECKTWNKAFN